MTVSAPRHPEGGALARAALEIARRFEGGSSMWCISPQWPSHARHIAVEFVHPVIVGKRALPAIALDGLDLPDTLELVARRSDILVAVGEREDEAVSRTLRGARDRGLLTVLIGAGPRPPESFAADHLLWTYEEEGAASPAYGGGFVLVYHLLWELTHVCFEHRGILEPHGDSRGDSPGKQPTSAVARDQSCTTCADEGRVCEVVALLGSDSAAVRMPSGVEPVDVSLIPSPRVGSRVLVHAGVAIASLGESGEATG